MSIEAHDLAVAIVVLPHCRCTDDPPLSVQQKATTKDSLVQSFCPSSPHHFHPHSQHQHVTAAKIGVSAVLPVLPRSVALEACSYRAYLSYRYICACSNCQCLCLFPLLRILVRPLHYRLWLWLLQLQPELLLPVVAAFVLPVQLMLLDSWAA
jgi:hypothetical protein